MSTRLEAELREQPEVAARLLDRLVPNLPAVGALLRSRGAEQTLLVARGSSDNAARYAQYLLPVEAGVTVTLATPSLATVYGHNPDVSRHAVVAVSQSGRSPDVVTVVEQARQAGRPTLAITNDPGSPLALAAEQVLDLGAGPEESVAATKTYTASLLALAAVSCALSGSRPRVDELAGVPDALAVVVDGTSGVEPAAEMLARHDRGVCVGRGLNLSTAHETALKVTELTGLLMAPYSPADLMHGPVAAVRRDTPVLLLAPEEPASASVLDVLPEVRRRGAPIVVVGSAGDATPGDAHMGDAHMVELPEAAALPGWLTPLTTTVAGQLLAWRTAEQRGVDVDRPGELSKVTLTR